MLKNRSLILVTLLLALASSPLFGDKNRYEYYNSIASYYPLAQGSWTKEALHDLIDDHNRRAYGDLWELFKTTDVDPNNSNNVIDIYKNASYPKQDDGSSPSNYAREHVWPKSYGFPTNNVSNNAYSDAHHLFPVNNSYNSSRNNRPFAYCYSNCSFYNTDVNRGQGGAGYPNRRDTVNDTWSTWNGRKGDVARAIMYMDVRYEGDNGTDPQLELTDNRALVQASSGNTTGTAYMAERADILAWHDSDRVDDYEIKRNDLVKDYQGNRNPFIDGPYWKNCIYNNNCLYEMTAGVAYKHDYLMEGNGRRWQVYIPYNATSVKFETYNASSNSTGDADLYVKQFNSPTTSSWDGRGYSGGNTETITKSNNVGGTWYIMVHAYRNFTDVNVKATWTCQSPVPANTTSCSCSNTPAC